MNNCYKQAQSKYEELISKRLTGYQKASVEAICNHFKTNKTALLADEVGLGKTEVAKGVIAKMALAHWESNQDKDNARPFRVAYICPNLNIAEQNFPKLNLYKKNIFEGNTDLQKALENALGAYRNTEGVKKIGKNQRVFLNRSSVYTRVCEWLIALCRGIDLEDAMGDVRDDYLSTVKRSDECKTTISKNKGYIKFEQQAEALTEACIKAVNDFIDISVLWEEAKEKKPDMILSRYYLFNKQVAAALYDNKCDYRLSMQHLIAAEEKKSGVVMQLESITPETSFKIGNSQGTFYERALLKASCEKIGAEPPQRGEQGEAQDFDVFYNAYKKRLNNCNNIKMPCKEELEKCTSYTDLRKCFIDFNIDNNIHYDLIIMDEFQNYPYVITKNNENKDAKEAYDRAQKIIDKSGNVLYLSATPFEFEDFIKDLLNENGVFRTERIAASKHSPVIERARIFDVCKDDFIYTLKANNAVQTGDDTEDYTDEDFDDGNNKYRSRYGWTTPYAFTFMGNYASSKEFYNNYFSGKSIDASLFLQKEQLINPEDSITLNHQCFEAMQSEIFEKGNRAAYMLWIPPCGCETKLKGAFEGMGGFSKTLIFAEYKMTPMAFSFLLCAEAQCILSKAGKYAEPDTDEIKQCISEKIENLNLNFGETQKRLTELFTGILTRKTGYMAVRKYYANEPYSEAVENYCNDGCFEDMIREYVELLEGEYNGDDNKMAVAVRRAEKMSEAEANLWLYNENANELNSEQLHAPNKFAVGIFDEKQKGINNLKSAFNSPVWPFVLSTTSVGTEGIDLHWYARHVVHWSVPKKYTDIEQREGRVLRYKCHAYRLNEHLGHIKEQCIKDEWLRSGMYETQLNFFDDNEFDISKQEKGGCYHVTRDTYFYRFSSEEEEYRLATESINKYRRKLGREDGIVRGNTNEETSQSSDCLCLAPWINNKE